MTLPSLSQAHHGMNAVSAQNEDSFLEDLPK